MDEGGDVDGRTAGRFRALASPRADGEWLLVGTEAPFEPTAVDLGGVDLRPGYLVDATVEWTDGRARATDVTVRERTLVEFTAGVTGLFEAARDAWREAEREGLGVNSRVTHSNDAQPNGACYVFANPPGAPDVFAEFRDGSRPLEPLLQRVEFPEPYEVFVMDPAEGPFVVVYIVFDRASLLADTVRDTYGCPRPPAPSDEG